MKPKFHRGYVNTKEWMEIWDRSDPGDFWHKVHVRFIPHKDALADLTRVMSVAEHDAIISESAEKMLKLEMENSKLRQALETARGANKDK